MTTENVAILFTDVVGSTELSHRLSPEVAEEVRRGHFSILRQAIAEAGGTEVKNLGDGLMVAFSSSSAALAAAVGMQQVVELDNREREHRVGLRVGISIGEVIREDDDYFGDAVVEAARICATCESGQILATDVVRLMAGRRNLHQCRFVGELTLKGLPEPVETVEVIWEPLDPAEMSTAIPLPRRLAVRPAVGVVGRESDIETIAIAAKRVASGEGREVLLISGEAGLGKTTLVAEAARAAFDTGAVVLFGHCEEDLATPYQLFAEVLGHYVTHAPEDRLLAHVAVHGSELARLVPSLARRIPDLPTSTATDTDSERFQLFAAVVGLLNAASTQEPVVIVLDDLQWADQGSLLMLRHLAASEQSMRVLVLGTYRDSELSQAHALREALGVLRRHSGVSRIELTGLDDTGVVTFLESAAGHTLDDAGIGLAHAVYRETDGNPFFVSEVLRHLSETGAIYQDTSGRWMSDDSPDQIALPDSVREVIGGRVVRLGPEAERVLAMAAVIGRDFDLGLLARATTTSEDDTLDILDAAAAVALVRELADTPGRYSFAHALIQRTLYEDLGATRRARAHRQVAEALEQLCGNRPGNRVGELARHWLAATQPTDLAKTIDYSRRAGDAALAALAPADALGYYAQALDLFAQADDSDPVLGLDLLIGLGTAQRQTGDPTSRGALLDAARRAAELGDTDRLVAAALANNRGAFSAAGVIDRDKVEVLEIALDRLPGDHPDRALVLATLCSELAIGSPLERRQELADSALAIAENSGDDASTLRVLNHILFPLLVPPLLDQSLSRTAQALARAERVGDPLQSILALLWRAFTAFRAGHLEEMDRCLEIMSSVAEDLGQPTAFWGIAILRATRAMISGDTDRVEELATEALQIGTDGGEPDATLVFGAQLIIVNLQRGTLGDFVPLLEEMAAVAPDLPGSLDPPLAVAHAESQRTDDVRRILERIAAEDFDAPMDSIWLGAMACYAEAATVVDDPRLARPLFDRLAPWHAQLVTTGGVSVLGPVSHYLGGLATVLDRLDEADAYFAESAATNARMGATFFAARTDYLWGRMLAQRHASGDIDKGRALLTNAHAVAAAHGYATVERRSSGALQQLDR